MVHNSQRIQTKIRQRKRRRGRSPGGSRSLSCWGGARPPCVPTTRATRHPGKLTHGASASTVRMRVSPMGPRHLCDWPKLLSLQPCRGRPGPAASADKNSRSPHVTLLAEAVRSNWRRVARSAKIQKHSSQVGYCKNSRVSCQSPSRAKPSEDRPFFGTCRTWAAWACWATL